MASQFREDAIPALLQKAKLTPETTIPW